LSVKKKAKFLSSGDVISRIIIPRQLRPPSEPSSFISVGIGEDLMTYSSKKKYGNHETKRGHVASSNLLDYIKLIRHIDIKQSFPL
jgi:hypothetical protein